MPVRPSEPHLEIPRAWVFAVVLAACGSPTAADTVDLGSQVDQPDLALDEGFFHCQIQPNVISQYSCASGAAQDSGGCHAEKSALRLVDVPDKPKCQNNRVIGTPPAESQINLDRVRIELGVDAESSPFYRRPVGLDSHPRVIFDAKSKAADLIRMWLKGSP